METLYEKLKSVTYEEFIKTLNIIATLKSPLILSCTVPFLADGFAEIERKNSPVTDILMNSRTYTNYRKLGRNILDFETNVEHIKQGILGYIWGASIIIRKKIPENTILVLSEPNKALACILLFEKESPDEIISELVKNISTLHNLTGAIQTSLKDIEDRLYKLTLKKE